MKIQHRMFFLQSQQLPKSFRLNISLSRLTALRSYSLTPLLKIIFSLNYESVFIIEEVSYLADQLHFPFPL